MPANIGLAKKEFDHFRTKIVHHPARIAPGSKQKRIYKILSVTGLRRHSSGQILYTFAGLSRYVLNTSSWSLIRDIVAFEELDRADDHSKLEVDDSKAGCAHVSHTLREKCYSVNTVESGQLRRQFVVQQDTGQHQ